MSFFKKLLLSISLVLLASGSVFAQRKLNARPTNSGGPLIFEQAAYDVQSYDITARVDPKNQSFSGTTIINARIVIPTNTIAIDLDTPFEISDISFQNNGKFESLKHERKNDKVFIRFPMSKQTGDQLSLQISYSGKPRVAPNPPWVGGFMWKKTADGSDWIANANQNDGADLWFPCKDHPSDEADSVSLHITVPEELYVASVGKLQKIVSNPDKTKTYNWFMSNGINNYNVVLNIAPYTVIEQNYKSIAGETFPIRFFALPEDVEKAKDIVAQTAKFLKFFEKYLGPYPYRAEKLGIAQTPHLGMEHSTIIAYGNNYKNNADGFDGLMLHELGHEWWGNLVTASDWRDMWIHEGFQSFMDVLYLEETKGKEAYFASMKKRIGGLRNKQPIAPRESKFTYQIYFAEPDYLNSDGDIYSKGALVLHSLRFLIGDDAFFRALHRMAYPEKELESYTDGRQNRLVTTDDFKQIAEEESKMDLDWFFEVYLRQPVLPRLNVEQVENEQGRMSVNLKWETPGDLPFNMPVEIKIDNEIKRVKFTENFGRLPIERGQELTVDPNGWVLKTQ